MSSIAVFNGKEEIARGILVREAGDCEQCTSWRHNAKDCRHRRIKAALCGIKDEEGNECAAMHHYSLS